ncbi:MAG: aminodeoxychorismate synthase component I [Burkholderiales bacterium]|nr:aminodeoxychorismate synthase component I [Burkholderiales bacterium]
MPSDTYALLDDASTGQVRLLHGLLAHLQCTSATALPALLQQMQEYLAAGRHAFLLMSYELGAQMHGVAARVDQQPYAQALIFTESDELDQAALASWFAQHSEIGDIAGVCNLKSSVDQAEFCEAIARIQEYIAAGDTYQVNFTYRLRFQAYGSPVALYQRLRARQPVPYGALVQLPDGTAILSLSPELFIRHTQGQLLAQPMKGTAPASSDTELNAARALALAQDEKNRAENLMIVDLLRNDVARIAEIGTVQVPKLFEVTQFSRVLQMTSTIRATLRADCDLPQIIQALYPCGSITGAPKRRTMEIIREIESTPRGIYTGALGWFAPPSKAHRVGDFCLSVPIRTMLLQAPQASGLRAGEMGVGAGIVYDSESMDEYRECQLKASFLTGLQTELTLFETMYASRREGCRNLAAHLARLQASCTFFGIPCETAALAQQLHSYCQQLQGDAPYRLKLSIVGDGAVNMQSALLTPLPEKNTLLIGSAISPVPPFLLAHKSSVRQHYDAAWQQAEKVGAFDMLFCNAKGHITEGGRSNIFVKLAGQWYTPPLHDGLLPGVMRAQLIQQWQAQERSLTLNDLRNATEVQVCNALRGAFQVELVWPQQAV